MRKIHMRTSQKGVSCGIRIPIDDMGTPPTSFRLTYDPSLVTCKSCLKKIASEKAWTSKKDIFTTGHTLRIVKNDTGQWEAIFYMNGYRLGNIRRKDGGTGYSTSGRAMQAAKCFRDSINRDVLEIIVD